MKKALFPLVFSSLCLLFPACKKNKQEDPNDPDCSKVNATYSAGIRPIISANCLSSGCHNSGSANGDFTGYAGLKAKVNNGSLDSRVIRQKNMPPTGALSNSDLVKIKCWINSGAGDN
jgi:hypothetical protein